MMPGQTELRAVLRVVRREAHRAVDSERMTVHGADSMLRVLQLAAAEVSKQEGGEFGVALSDVLAAWRCLLQDKLGLSSDSAPRPDNFELILKEYQLFLQRTNSLDLIDIFNLYKDLKRDDDPAEPLTSMQLFKFLQGDKEPEEEQVPQVPATPSNRARPCSLQVRRVVRTLLSSYLGLLVNFKNDLALAVTLDTPSRALGHTAFTDLKRAARRSSTSMFLAATSFVRAIHLGGKGYAPPESDPLRKHVKGLCQFIQFTDQLEEILGEVPDPSTAVGRMLSTIKSALLKGRANEDPVHAAVENTITELKGRIQEILDVQKASAGCSGISPARPRVYAINHATAYAGRETVKVLLTLLDEEAVAPPCRNRAQLLSDDQGLLNGAEAGGLLSLYRSPEASTGLSPKPLRNRVLDQQEQPKPQVRGRVIRSQFACTYRDDDDEDLPLNRVLNFPTGFHPAPKPADPSVERDVPEVDAREPAVVDAGSEALSQRCGNRGRPQSAVLQKPSGKPSKRKLSNRDGVDHADDENQPPQKRPSNKVTTVRAKKSNSAPNKKLLAGQGKLTSFFRL